MSGDGVSEVSPQTGALLAGPFQVAHLVDGNGAYPLSAEGRQTYQDSQFAPRGRLSRPPSTTTRSDCRSTTQATSRDHRL